MLSIRGLYEVAIPVKELERAEEFYVGTLGLSVGLRDESRRWIFLRAGDRAGMVVLQERGSEVAPYHFAFTVDAPELERAGALLQERGVAVAGPFVHDWIPGKSLYFSDP